MRKRLRKKLLKKEQRALPCSADNKQPVIAPVRLKDLAIECWRIRNLLPDFACSKKQAVLRSVVDKMTALLLSAGIEIEDPTGWDYKDGMNLNVALCEDSQSLPFGVRRITETLSPNVYIDGTIVQSARVIVSIGKGEK
jgi:hypothetical protein